jgi:predicted outer membrane repeat protein
MLNLTISFHLKKLGGEAMTKQAKGRNVRGLLLALLLTWVAIGMATWVAAQQKSWQTEEQIAPISPKATQAASVPKVWAALVNLQVTTTADTGEGSLRAVLAAASDGDTITFATSLAGQTITLASDLPEISVNTLTLDAASFLGKVTVDGGDIHRLFYHTGTGVLTIDNMVLQNGVGSTDVAGTAGGGVYSVGSVMIVDSTISSNAAADFGGGIYSDGDVTVINSVISDNAVVGFSGGGIYSRGKVTVSDSTLSNNSADFGGGIYSNGDVTLSDSTITANAAVDSGGGVYGQRNVTISDSTIGSNSAGNVGGGIVSVGNIVFFGCTTVEGNTAATNAQGQAGGTVSDDIGLLPDTNSDAPYIGCP